MNTRASGVSDRIIVTVYACTCALVLKFIYTYSPSGRIVAAASSSLAGGLDEKTINKIYSMGFDEATLGKPYSPPTASVLAAYTAEFDYAANEGSDSFNPPPPASAAGLHNLLSISGLFSFGLLGKFVFELGSGPGGWAPANAKRNLEGQGMMKMMMPMFSLYRLYSAYKGN